MPTDAAPAFNNKSPNTPEVPTLLADTDTLPKLVSASTPDEITMGPSKAEPPLPPLIAKTPPLVLPSSNTRLKHTCAPLDGAGGCRVARRGQGVQGYGIWLHSPQFFREFTHGTSH